VILVGMGVGAVFAIGNWEQYLGYELFQAVLYPLLCAIFILPGMLFADEYGGSARLRKWGKILLYLLGLWFFLYGVFLYYNLPRVAGAGGAVIVDQASLVWVQQMVYNIYTSPAAMIAYAVIWVLFVQLVTRLKIVPNIHYLGQLDEFFKKMDRPVDVKAEMGEDFDQVEADLSSFKILGVVIIIVSSLMGLFFTLDLTGREHFITFCAMAGNLAIGIVLFWLGTRKNVKKVAAS